MAKKKQVSIETNDQNFGGTFNAHKNWKKLREKHRRHEKLGLSGPCTPEIYAPAGKGDRQRTGDTPKEIYDLNYDLAFGKITHEEHKKRLEKFWEGFNQ